MVELWHHSERNDVINGQLVARIRASDNGGRAAPPHLRQTIRSKAPKLVRDPEIPNHGINGQLRCMSRHARECCGFGCTLHRVQSRLLGFKQLSDILLHAGIRTTGRKC